MLIAPLLSLLFAQAAAPGGTVEEARLQVCMDEARTDPATAITTASSWVSEAQGAELAFPQQCLGFAYSSLLRWQAAEEAFLAAREAKLDSDAAPRARLAAMAGNAALADGRHATALTAFDLAAADAAASGNTELTGEIAADRARALVGLDRLAEAGQALADARRDAPQQAQVWLLSATLSRRLDMLEAAQSQIETAAALATEDPAIGLEAGLIAALGGRDDAARQSWQSVIALAPGTPEAATATDYLTQLDGAVPGR